MTTRQHLYPIIQSYTLQDSRQKGQLPVHIYLLCDPFSGTPLYVGQTIKPITRLVQHCCRYAECGAWARELKEAGLSPRLDVVAIVDPDEADAAEQFWIDRLIADGYALVNPNIRRNQERKLQREAKEQEMAQKAQIKADKRAAIEARWRREAALAAASPSEEETACR